MDFKLLNYGDKDNKLFLEEYIDTDKLNYIIENYEELKLDINQEKYKNPTAILKNYLKNCFDGKINVRYIQKEGVCRYYACNSLSLQSLPKCIRQTIAINYIDIDIVNCHFVLLGNLCEKLDIHFSSLKKYIDNRDFYITALSEMGCKNPKNLFIMILYSDDNSYLVERYKKFQFIKDFVCEIKNIQLLMKAKHEEQWDFFEKKKNKTKNKLGSFMSYILQDYESKILDKMFNYLNKPKNCVLCFDGMLISKDLYSKKILHKLEKHIKNEFNIIITLVVKPFDKIIPLPEVIPEYNGGKFNYYSDYSKLIGVNIKPDIVDKWIENGIALIDSSGKSCILTKNRDYDHLTKQMACSYKMIKLIDIMKTLDVIVNIINPDYDKNKADKIDKKILKNPGYKMSPLEQKFYFEFFTKSIKNIIEEKIKYRALPHFSGVNFIPFLTRNGLPEMYGKFNMFAGFPYDNKKVLKKINFEKSHIYNHLLNEFCDSDIHECNHLLDHIADIIQQPAKIRGIGHLFFSQQGTGKGTIAFFMSKLLGKDHCVSFENIENYFKNFNVDSSNKLFKIIEEVSDKGHAFNKSDILKADLTKSRERVEPKGVDAYSVDHFARYWFFTNNERALHIENSDRRYTMHRINNRYKNDMKYFAPIYEEVNDDNFCHNAFEFFANRKYEVKNVMTVYENNFKKEQKILNLSNTAKFIKEIIESNYKGFKFIKKRFINCKLLKEFYADWCRENGFKYNSNTFKTQMRTLDINEEFRKTDGKSHRVYNLDKKLMIDKFKEFLSDDTFDFNTDTSNKSPCFNNPSLFS